MTPKVDPDISAVKACVKALKRTTSPRITEATLRYLWDRFITNPPKQQAKATEP